jgi:hypothetical protein
MADLGDIGALFKAGSVPDLDWLEVTEKDYKDLEKVPEQNLDVIPGLEKAWAEGSAAAGIVPNKGSLTMYDVGKGKKKASSETIESVRRVARFALMKSEDPARFRHELTSRFDRETLAEARPVLASVLAERGLIGRFYVEANDFSGCSNGAKPVSDFVRRYASEAPYVVAKSACGGCIHNAGNTCAVFHKQIVVQVPYTEELAKRVEQKQASKGKLISASSLVPRERIRNAYLAESVKIAGPAEAPKPVVDPLRFMTPTQATPKVHLPMIASQQKALLEQSMAVSFDPATGKTAAAKVAFDKKAHDVSRLLRREMLRGRSERELVEALKLSFSAEDLRETRGAWEPIFKEAGFYGTLYSTQDSFDDCSAGVDYLAKHNPSIRAVVAGEKCQGCFYNKMGRCLAYGKKLVASAEEVMTDETLAAVVREHKLAGRLGSGAEKAVWGESPREALKNVYRVASTTGETPRSTQRTVIERAFSGSSSQHVTAGLTRREIVKTASRFLNEGLYGADLMAALKKRFDPRDILAAKDELRPVLAEQGLQGIYYVDPSIYGDYGKGCDEAGRLHRSRLVAYVKKGSACDSCVLQTRLGYCSKLNKNLVYEPPYENKAAQQREILASGKSTETRYEDLVNNGRTMLAEFGMASEMAVDLDPVRDAGPSLEVDLGIGKVKL